jgi:carboxypeptidase T
MRNSFIFKCLLVYLLSSTFSPIIFAQQVEIHSRVRIKLDALHSIEQLASLGIETDHGYYMPGHGLVTELSASELQRVVQAGFVTRVIVPDVKAAWMSPQPIQERSGCNPNNLGSQYQTPTNYQAGTYGGYFRYQEMINILDNMYQNFPNLITVRKPITDTLTTHQGRPIYWVRISDNAIQDEPEPEVLYTALHHSREPNSLSQMLFYMWYLLENYATDPEVKYIVDNTELYFVPCVNPDGYLRNELTDPAGGGLWRLNMRDNLDGTFGVDLNRNYGFQWGYDNIGSSPNPGALTYRGTTPFSEPETRMMKLFCEQRDFKFALNYHTFSNLLIYPWAWSDELADPAFAEYAKILTSENKYKAGTATETVGYQVNGSSDDFMFGQENIFSMTPEVGPASSGFWPSSTEIDGLNKSTVLMNLLTAQLPIKLAIPSDASMTTSTGAAKVTFQVQRYGLQDGPFTISVQPISNNIASVVTPQQVINLVPFQSSAQSFDLTLVSNIQPSDTVRVRILVHNGQYARALEVAVPYSGQTVQVLNNPLNTLVGWQQTIPTDWLLTTEHFYSAPTSCTDSPGASYASNAYTSTTTINPVFIPANALGATLRYQARWELESGFDYVFIDVGSNGSFAPQCATSTTVAAPAVPTTPVYTGAQTTWRAECVDLQQFVGKPVQFGFTLRSDDFIELDGFYFDDVVIEYTLATGTEQVHVNEFGSMVVQPNPAKAFAQVSWTGMKSAPRKLSIYDAKGSEVYVQQMSTGTEANLQLQSLAAGTYRVVVIFAEGETLNGTIQVVD